MEPLTTDMILVMCMIGLAVFLFVVEWVRVDVVAILMMVALPLLHLVTPKEAFVGMSSNAVISIIAVIIIGAGLDRTGLINKLVKPVMVVAGKSASRIIIAISLTVAFISSFMQNIGAAAPMFCMKLEMKATVKEMAMIMREALLPATTITGLTSLLMRPVRSSPAPMMITAMMDITALLLMPTKASFGVTRCNKGKATIIRIATTSTRTHSTTKRKTARPIMHITRIMSVVRGSI